jgi:hypothetical protein
MSVKERFSNAFGVFEQSGDYLMAQLNNGLEPLFRQHRWCKKTR